MPPIPLHTNVVVVAGVTGLKLCLIGCRGFPLGFHGLHGLLGLHGCRGFPLGFHGLHGGLLGLHCGHGCEQQG